MTTTSSDSPSTAPGKAAAAGPSVLVRTTLLAVAVLLGASTRLGAAESPRKSFDVPSSEAIAALKQFSTQAGEQLLFSTTAVDGLKTNAIKGEFTPREALEKMVLGTGLLAAQDEKTGALVVTRAADPKAQGAAPLPASDRPRNNTAGNKRDVATGDTVAMSPFEVSTTKDNGYYTPNTMSGTRIDSKLIDLGASITVVTRQQLIDTGAIDLNDVFKYEANTEGTADYNAAVVSAQGTFGNVNDRVQSSPATANRVRGISSPNIAINNFATTARVPIDTYNIDSVEIGRGPSSTLFGLGSPSGTVSINRASANASRLAAKVELRGDSYGGYRGTTNLNVPIVRDRLGIRIATVYMENAYRQKPSEDLTRRLYGAFVFHPFKNTTLRGSYEQFSENRQTPNSITPWDGISDWIRAGKPVWNPVTFTYTRNGVTSAPIPVGAGATAETLTLPPGLWTNTSIYSRPTMFIDAGGVVRGFEINRLSTGNNPNVVAGDVRRMMTGQLALRGDPLNPLSSPLHVSDKSIYDWSAINAAAVNWNSDDAKIYNVELQQKLAPGLYARGAWYLVSSDSFNRNGANLSGPNLVMDVNTTLLDGRPNPFFLRPYYYQLESPVNRQPEYNDNLQAQLAYEYNAARAPGWRHWLGRHRIMGYYESRHVTNGVFRYRDGIVDFAHVWQTAGLNVLNGPLINRPTFNYYVGDTGAVGFQKDYNLAKSGTNGVYNLRYFNGQTRQWVDEPATIGTGRYQDNQSRQEVTSRGAVLQSSLIEDRVVLTGGVRRDFNRTRNSNVSVIDPKTGFADDTPLDTWMDWTAASGLTRTLSVVGRPLRWLGLTYNRSESFQPAPQAVSFFGDALPNPTGKGRDIGLNVNLWDDKVVVALRIYKNEVANSRLSTGSPITSRVTVLESSANSYALSTWARDLATRRLGTGASAAQISALARTIMQLPEGSPIQTDGSGTVKTISALTDLEATGGELEVNFNPSPNWNFKFAGAETNAVIKSVDADISRYIALRMPLWTTLRDDAGNPYWTSGGTNSPAAYFVSNIKAVVTLDQALQGKSNEQIKKYTWRTLANYRFTTGRLKNVGVGGSLRWNARSVIGYLGAPAESDGVVRDYDPNKPVYDPAAFSGDLWASYRLKLFANRIPVRIQVNLQDAFESGGIRKIKVNPNGVASNYRIINPQKWVLTTTFEY